MPRSSRASIATLDGAGGRANSIVGQTTDIINRFRNSLIRSRKERLLDEDVHATQNIVDQLHFTELMATETLGKLIMQGDSMQRSYGLINQLQKDIKDIAEDLNEVNGGRCWGAYSNGTLFGFACFGCLGKNKTSTTKKKKKRRRRRNDLGEISDEYAKGAKANNGRKAMEQNVDAWDQTRWVND